MNLTKKFYIDNKLSAVTEFARPSAVYLDSDGGNLSKITKQFFNTVIEIAEWCMSNGIDAQPWLDFTKKKFYGVSKDIVYQVFSDGKRALEAVCYLLKSKSSDLENSKMLMQNFIADGRLSNCVSGFNIGIKNLSLALNNNTLPAFLQGLRYSVVQSLALDYVVRKRLSSDGEHIHVVNALCDLVSEMFDLPSISDPLARQNFIDEALLDFINLCERKGEILFIWRWVVSIAEQASNVKTYGQLLNFEAQLNQIGPDPDFLLNELFEFDNDNFLLVDEAEVNFVVRRTLITRLLNKQHVEMPGMIVHDVDAQTTLCFFENDFSNSWVRQKLPSSRVRFSRLDAVDCSWNILAKDIDLYKLLPIAAKANDMSLVEKFINSGANAYIVHDDHNAIDYAIKNSNPLMTYYLYSKIGYVIREKKFSFLLSVALGNHDQGLIEHILSDSKDIKYLDSKLAARLLIYAVTNADISAMKLLSSIPHRDIPVESCIDALVIAAESNDLGAINLAIDVLPWLPFYKYCCENIILFDKISTALNMLLLNKNYPEIQRLLDNDQVNQQHVDRLGCGRLLLAAIHENNLEACNAFLKYKYIDIKNIILNGKISEKTDRRILLALERYLSVQQDNLCGPVRQRQKNNKYLYAVPSILKRSDKIMFPRLLFGTLEHKEGVIALFENTEEWFVFDSLQEAKVLAYCIAERRLWNSYPIVYKCNNFLSNEDESYFSFLSTNMLLNFSAYLNVSQIKQVMLKQGCTEVPQFLKTKGISRPMEAMYFDSKLNIKKISMSNSNMHRCSLLPF